VVVYPSTGFTPVIFNIDLLGHQSDPSVAGLANDGFVVAFENNDGALSGIFAHVYDASRTLVADIPVNTQIAGSQYNPHVAASPDGLTFVVTWQSNIQAGGSGLDVVARRFSSDGVALGSEILVNSYTPQTQSNPRVAFFPNGQHYVIAYEGRESTSYGVHVKRYNSNNDEPEGADTYVNLLTQICWPSVTTLSNDLFVVVFTRYAAGGAIEVDGQVFDASGNAVGSQFQINTMSTNQQIKPRVAAYENQFMVTWQSNLQEEDILAYSWGVYGQLFFLV